MRCPYCQAETRQIKAGFSRARSQHYRCRECGRCYTPEAKESGYEEEKWQQALRLIADGASFRRTARLVGGTTKRASTGFGQPRRSCRQPYRSLVYTPALHTPMPDKSETYRVEGDNAELHHYIARLARASPASPATLSTSCLLDVRHSLGQSSRPGPTLIKKGRTCSWRAPQDVFEFSL